MALKNPDCRLGISSRVRRVPGDGSFVVPWIWPLQSIARRRSEPQASIRRSMENGQRGGNCACQARTATAFVGQVVNLRRRPGGTRNPPGERSSPRGLGNPT